MSDQETPDPTSTPAPKEPHLLFRMACDRATKTVGGNMDGFLMLYTYRGSLPQERLITYGIGGVDVIQSELFTECAAQMLRRILSKTDNNLAAALAVFNGEVVKRLLTTKAISS